MNPPEPQQIFSLDMKREHSCLARDVSNLCHIYVETVAIVELLTHFHLQKKNIREKTKKIEGFRR